ncbi:hypothetical protein U9M48_000115 [Paspalum notatum var. saurae]|uniref:Retrotransposon gag domain-containing protein n=1 Tax=Paspalum notatum var. saurae TaxID=547442 RepID=A0AAQ3PL41_PASNO
MMVNTRNQANGNPPQNPPQNPPPLTADQSFQLQMQMMATLNNAIQALQNIQANPQPQQRDRRGDFMKGHPPTFSHSADSLQADDWLHAVERQLDIAQCNDQERVLYIAGQLRGAALDWWESYSQQDRERFTWAQFRERFRSHHVPAGIMKMKKKEFLSLKQGNMSVTEYRDKFLQLARYAPTKVAEDDRALLTEQKRREIDEKKRKLNPASSNSNTRPRYPQQYQQRQQPQQQQYQQQTGQGQRYQNQNNALPTELCHRGSPTHLPKIRLLFPWFVTATSVATVGTSPTTALRGGSSSSRPDRTPHNSSSKGAPTSSIRHHFRARSIM